MPYPDSIETARLLLRRPRAGDGDAIFAAYAQDAEVARHMIWVPHKEVGITRDFIAWGIAAWEKGEAFPYIVTLKTTGEIAGMLEARTTRARPHVANIGYVLARKHWGTGLMPEAIRAFAAVALALPAIFRVEATCAVENLASARALEKSGFVREGRLARHTLHPNLSPEPGDCLIYALTR